MPARRPNLELIIKKMKESEKIYILRSSQRAEKVAEHNSDGDPL